MPKVLVALLAIGYLAGCAASRPDVVTIDRSFLRTFPDHPREDDLAGHYRELQFLAQVGDPAAVHAILLYFTSDHWRAGPGCPCHATDALALAACDEEGPDGVFWPAMARLSPERQARAILHYSLLYRREDSFGMRLYSMVDFEGERDAFLEANPLALAAIRRTGPLPWAAAETAP